MGDKVTVLVVEDEHLIRFAVAAELEDAGFEVLEASNADEAIEVLTFDRRIRLMFTDVDMPGSMDGLRLAAAVRNRWPPISIIVTSGHRLVSSAEMPDGSVFFSKPYAPQELLQSMHALLSAQPPSIH